MGFAITAAGAVVAAVGTLTDRSLLHWAALAVACVGILVAFVGIIYHTVEFFARMRSKLIGMRALLGLTLVSLFGAGCGDRLAGATVPGAGRSGGRGAGGGGAENGGSVN